MHLDNVSDIYPLTSVQQGILYHGITRPNSGAYIDQVVASVRGVLDLSAFQQAWSTVINRHEALRAAFLWDGLDAPLQVIREHVQPKWRHLNWQQLDSETQSDRLNALVAENRRRGMELAEAPLLNLSLCRTAPEVSLLVVCFHHIVADGWSLRSLLDQVAEVYSAIIRQTEANLPAAFRFRDFVQWQMDADHAAAHDFWREQLADFESPNQLFSVSAQLPDSAGSVHDQTSLRVSPELSTEVSEFARTHQLTLNSVVQGVWSLVISRNSGQQDTVFGVTVSGRTHELAGIENAVGMFINTLPLRSNCGGDQPVIEWLGDLQLRQLRLQQWQFSDLAAIKKLSPVESPDSLFESILVFENYPATTNAGQDRLIEFADIMHHEHSNYPLALIVVPEPELELHLVFDQQRCPRPRARRLLQQCRDALVHLVRHPETPVGQFDILTREEKQLLTKWNNVTFHLPDDRLIHERIAEHARTHPEKTAVAFGNQSLTYEQLNQLSDRLAMFLRRGGVAKGDRIGLLLEPCPEMIVGILGILKAGAAYTPLDPNYPPPHLRFVVEDAGISIVLTNDLSHVDLPGETARLVDIEQAIETNLADTEDGNLTCQITGDDLAYVLYTSGSTGRPKGVKVTHANLLHSTQARQQYYRESVGGFLLLSSFAFDSSVAGIFWTLLDGGCLVLMPNGMEQEVDRLVQLVERHQVSHTLCLSSLYRVILGTANLGQLKSLTTVIVAGEACDQQVVSDHFAALPGVKLFNEYGPSEATVWSTVYEFDGHDDLEGVPIGQSVPGMSVYLLDDEHRRVPAGACGEICVAGPQVTSGYVNLPELTNERFVNVTIDGSAVLVYRTGDIGSFDEQGNLHFVGRRDAQVKLRGHRIELGGIQSAVAECSSIQEVVVSMVDRLTNGTGRQSLVAWCVMAGPDTNSFPNDEFLDQIRGRLPQFMIPDRWIAVAQIPRLPNGKVDHRTLESLMADNRRTTPDDGLPRTELERKLSAVWKETLGLDQLSIHDNFFSLGGDSIISIQIISRARQAGIFFEPGELAANPTVTALAAVSRCEDLPSESIVATTEPFPLSPIQAWFFSRKLTIPAHWNQSQLFELTADFDPAVFEAALRICIDRHEMLRARFEHTGDGWLQSIVPTNEQPLPFSVVDCGDDDPENLKTRFWITQSGLDLAEGPLLQAVSFQFQDHCPRLLIAVHHLVIDVLSWQVLIDDLTQCYQTLKEGSSAITMTESRPATYRNWVESLTAIADSVDSGLELQYWVSMLSNADATIPVDTVADPLFERDGDTITVRLSHDDSAYLGRDANEAFNSSTRDLLLAALALTVTEWTGRSQCYLELEGHGRDGYANSSRFSGTLGWFTCSYPVLLQIPRSHDLADCIKAIKEQLRSIPQSGTGFGILKYLSSNAEARALNSLPTPAILFNYLGQRLRPQNRGWLRPIPGAESSSRSPDNQRSHVLEINASIEQGEFQMKWIYNRKCHLKKTVEDLADNYLENLRMLLQTCRVAKSNFTPSDFPDSGLNQEQLDQLLDEFE